MMQSFSYPVKWSEGPKKKCNQVKTCTVKNWCKKVEINALTQNKQKGREKEEEAKQNQLSLIIGVA